MSLRVMGFMDELVTRAPEETAIAVSHGNAMVAIVHWWLNLGEEHWSRISFDFDPASITKLTVNRWGEKVISSLNDTSHLRGL
jgi:probable phosphoglycerate mutase